MKKTIISTLVICILFFGMALDGHAILFSTEDPLITGTWNEEYLGYEGSEWSGYFIGLFGGNDSEALLEFWAEEYLNTTFFETAYDKVDPVPGTGAAGILTATATVFKDDDEPIGGTWSVVSPYELGFYSVMGASQWALYYVHPYQSSGLWSTIHLETVGGTRPEISHLSALSETAAVPEPSTMLFLGICLVGLAGVSKRQLIRRN